MKETNQERHLRLSKRINHIEDELINEFELYFLCGKTSPELDTEKEYFILYSKVKYTNKIICKKCKDVYDLMVFK